MSLVLIVSIVFLVLIGLGLLYWYLLVFGAALPAKQHSQKPPVTRFAVTIPAHNEEDVIAATVRTIRAAHYPQEWITVYVVADHCTDATAERAQDAGAVALERNDGPRGSKGAALRWLFDRIFEQQRPHDAIVIFDADSNVDGAFFTAMDLRLQSGAQVVQGNHVISNPKDGWFAALTWAMFLIDNRFQNQGRANLGFSAKNMGDAICFRAEILRKHGWGEGLTEDYAFRQMLLLENIRIAYEPRAKSFGQAPWNWQIAQKQRLRWIRGAQEASQNYRAQLWKKGWQTGSTAMIEGALQGFIPSYSTLTLAAELLWLAHLLLAFFASPLVPMGLVLAWTVMVALLFLYPFIGLALEKAPQQAHMVILTGPIFILWRTWLSLTTRLGHKPVTWVRTPHRGQP